MNALAVTVPDRMLWGPGWDGSPVAAMQDITDGVVRFVGTPDERIAQDNLRPFRAPRMALKHPQGKLACATVAAIRRNLHLLPGGASQERMRAEFIKTLASSDPRGIDLWDRMGLIEIIIPEVGMMKSLMQNRYHRHDVWRHTLLGVQRLTPRGTAFAECVASIDGMQDMSPIDLERAMQRIAMLLHDIGKPATAQAQEGYGNTFHGHDKVGAAITLGIARKRLLLPSSVAKKLSILVERHMFLAFTEQENPSMVRRWVARVAAVDPSLVLPLVAIREADIKAQGYRCERTLRKLQAAEAVIKETETPRLPFSGCDVMKVLRIRKGDPRVGQVMRRVKEWAYVHPGLTDEDLWGVMVQEAEKINE